MTSPIDSRTYDDELNLHYVKTQNLQVGPLLYPNRDGSSGQVIGTDGKGHLSFIGGGGTIGNVSGPASSIDNTVALFSGTTGKLLKTSLGLINGAGQLTIPSLVAAGLAFPTVDGTPGQVMSTNGSGVLSFSTNGSGDVVGPASSTDNALARFDGTTGKLLQNSTALLSDSGNLTVSGLTVGAFTFPSVDGTNGQVLTTNGAGTASWQNVPSSSGSMNRLIGLQSSSIALNISAGDHIQFDSVLGSNGATISLDVATPYSNAANVASVGRITLQPAHTYVLYGTMQGLNLLLAIGSMSMQWFNADTNTAVATGTGGSILGLIGLGGVNAPTAVAVVTPGVATRYELRITSAVSLSATGITILDVTQIV